MIKNRRYHQGCNIAYALDVVGERWSLLLIRELLLGPKRYGELLKNLEGMGTNLLSTRLKELESVGVIEKSKVDTGKRKSYSLTHLGQGLESVLREVVRWGSQLPETVRDPKDSYRPDWDLIATKLHFRKEAAPDLEGVVVLADNETELLINVGKNGLSFAVEPDAISNTRIEGNREALKRLITGNASYSQLLKTKAISVSGSKTFAREWASCFAR
jgi:DNA-binding HxlR family transcriptional regulator